MRRADRRVSRCGIDATDARLPVPRLTGIASPPHHGSEVGPLHALMSCSLPKQVSAQAIGSPPRDACRNRCCIRRPRNAAAWAASFLGVVSKQLVVNGNCRSVPVRHFSVSSTEKVTHRSARASSRVHCGPWNVAGRPVWISRVRAGIAVWCHHIAPIPRFDPDDRFERGRVGPGPGRMARHSRSSTARRLQHRG